MTQPRKRNAKVILRQMVREEVAMAIHEVIAELKQPVKNEQKNSNPKSQKRITEKTNFSNNSIINNVLNETANADIEWETLNGGTFDSSKMNEVMAKQNASNGQNNKSNLAASLGVNPNNPPDFLTKDYSQILKKVDEKVKQTRG